MLSKWGTSWHGSSLSHSISEVASGTRIDRHLSISPLKALHLWSSSLLWLQRGLQPYPKHNQQVHWMSPNHELLRFETEGQENRVLSEGFPVVHHLGISLRRTSRNCHQESASRDGLPSWRTKNAHQIVGSLYSLGICLGRESRQSSSNFQLNKNRSNDNGKKSCMIRMYHKSMKVIIEIRNDDTRLRLINNR